MSQKAGVIEKHTIMRVFNAKGVYKDLLEAVKEFRHPIEFNSSQTQTVIRFFDFASTKIPEIRNVSTGREYELQSIEAIRMFGEPLARSMYVTMNKLTYLMTCKFIYVFGQFRFVLEYNIFDYMMLSYNNRQHSTIQ
jgi:hypothetical protein